MSEIAPLRQENTTRSTTTITKTPPPQPLRLAGYRLDPSPLGMIRLLYLKNYGYPTFLDPSVDGNVYGLPPWLLIREEDEPQFSDTYEYLLYSERFHHPARPGCFDEEPVKRKLQGEASVLFWKMSGSPTFIIDRVSEVQVGTVTHFSLSVTGRDDVKLNWYLSEYVAMAGAQRTSLCKLRMDSDSLKKLRADVKRCSKVLDAKLMDHQLECHRQRDRLPDDHPLVVAVSKAQDALGKAKTILQNEVRNLRQRNVIDFNRILGRETLLEPAPLAFDALLDRATIALSDPQEPTLEVVYDDVSGLGRFRVVDGERCHDSFRCLPV